MFHGVGPLKPSRHFGRTLWTTDLPSAELLPTQEAWHWKNANIHPRFKRDSNTLSKFSSSPKNTRLRPRGHMKARRKTVSTMPLKFSISNKWTSNELRTPQRKCTQIGVRLSTLACCDDDTAATKDHKKQSYTLNIKIGILTLHFAHFQHKHTSMTESCNDGKVMLVRNVICRQICLKIVWGYRNSAHEFRNVPYTAHAVKRPHHEERGSHGGMARKHWRTSMHDEITFI